MSELTDRGRRCSKLYAPEFDFTCTLLIDHGGENHEDHVTDAPSIVAWRKRELIETEEWPGLADLPAVGSAKYAAGDYS